MALCRSDGALSMRPGKTSMLAQAPNPGRGGTRDTHREYGGYDIDLCQCAIFPQRYSVL